jgi:tetratricopeptide (TPR) repeat protein
MMATVNIRGPCAALLMAALFSLAACGGPALTPLQTQYQREQERALRHAALGQLPRALQAYRDSLHWAELTDNRPAMVAQALNVGVVALSLGEWALAEHGFQQAQRIAAGLQDSASGLQARLGLAQVELRQSRFETARAAFAAVLAEARGRDSVTVLIALNGLGLAQQGLEQWPEAEQTLRAAEGLARSHGEPRLLAATLANRAALILRTSGDANQAAVVLEEAVSLDRAAEHLPGLAQDLALLARAREQLGDTQGARDLYQQARTIARHTGQPLPVELNDRIEADSSRRLQPARLKSPEQERPPR